MRMPNHLRSVVVALAFLILATALGGAAAQDGAPPVDYLVKPGDTLLVSVWKEPDMTMEALVRPDGKFSFPLAGDIQASGKSVAEIQAELVKKIETYIPDAVATVMVTAIEGNKAYVVGKVNRPGPILMTSDTNVMQALSIAGGTAQFASLKNIKILRGQGSSQSAIDFNYDAVQDGNNLEQNITLQAGDVVVVP